MVVHSFRAVVVYYYDGSNLSGNEDVIMVTINYRLGIFGFLPITDSINGNKGMNGIVDQIHALEWIQDRISFFGGYGKSVSLLSVIPQATGLL
jgi:para-nitrobenzyl esterase